MNREKEKNTVRGEGKAKIVFKQVSYSKIFNSCLFFLKVESATERGKLCPGMSRGNHPEGVDPAGRGQRYQPRNQKNTARRKAPDTPSRLDAPNASTRSNVMTLSAPRRGGWRHGADPAWRRRCWPGCHQARAQPISCLRRRRPAFELRTATSCCLASTQCNAVCLSALRHKGTAILWLSWTCTKMSGAPRVVACDNYQAALYFCPTARKRGEGE